MRPRTVAILALVAVAGPAAYLLKPRLFPEEAVSVRVARVERGEVRETVASPSAGTVVSRREALVAAECSARVKAVLVREGAAVGAGDDVILLEADDAQVELDAAEAALAARKVAHEEAEAKDRKAKEDLDRIEQMAGRLVREEEASTVRTAREVAALELKRAELLVREAEVAKARARVTLARRRVRAPFAGIVRRLAVEQGEHVVPGGGCFELYDAQAVFVRAPIDEVDLPRVEEGDACVVRLAGFERTVEGRVRKVLPAVKTEQQLNRTGEVEVDLLERPASLRLGVSADIEVATEVRPDVLRVPAVAVHEDRATGARYVHVVEGERAARRDVALGASGWDFAEVASGLRAGEVVVVAVEADTALVAGARVRAQPEAPRPEAVVEADEVRSPGPGP